MLTKPPLSDDAIVRLLGAAYTLTITDVTFLPLGADMNSAVYRVTNSDGMPYFLKLRRGDFTEEAVAVPAYLHAQGIHAVMAPLTTTSCTLWVHEYGYDWILYPFLDGTDGWNVPLSAAQWAALGAALKAIHTTRIPPNMAARLPVETFSPHLRNVVRSYAQSVRQRTFDDHIAEQFATFWRANHDEIEHIVERAEHLAERAQQHSAPLVLCHTDIHAGNVMLGANDAITIVDWDNPALAPKERDLMFVGGGIGRYWSNPEDGLVFYQAYGATTVDWDILCYYRYERIVAEFAAYGDQIFGVQGDLQDREVALEQVTGQFGPGNVLAIAHATYEQHI